MRIAIAAAALLLSTFPALSQCFVGASAGTTLATTRADIGGVALDFGGQGLMGGGEIGCAYTFTPKWAIGALARYDVANIRASAAGDTITSSGRYMGAATISYDLNPHAKIYALGGLASNRLKIEQVEGKSFTGIVMGAGVDLSLGTGPWSLFAEVDRITYRSRSLGGVDVKPDETAARVGFRYAIGK